MFLLFGGCKSDTGIKNGKHCNKLCRALNLKGSYRRFRVHVEYVKYYEEDLRILS